MVARRQSRDLLERYDTPAWCTRALLAKYPQISRGVYLEPCAGAGAISSVLVQDGPCAVISYDVAPRAAGIVQADTLVSEFWRRLPRTSVITNPPFSRGAELWRLASHAGAPLIALLLRLSWLEAADDRADIPDPDTVIVLPRPSFIESPEARAIREAAGKKWSGDSVTSAWMVWEPGAPRRGVIRVTRRDKRAYERWPVAGAA